MKSASHPATSHLRLGVTGAMIVFISLIIVGQLFLTQVMDQKELRARAADFAPPSQSAVIRGPIYDDVGNVLAISDETYQVNVDPTELTNPWYTAGILAPLLHVSRIHIFKEFGSHHSSFTLLPAVSQAVANALGRSAQEQANWPITLGPNPARVYPQGTLAAHILGFASPRYAGYLTGEYGLEQEYDPFLNGVDPVGKVVRWARQNHFRVIRRSGFDGSEVLNIGASLHLSIDSYDQDIADEVLSRQVKRMDASSGTIIITEPKSGRILALANYPWFNPNSYGKSKLWKLKNAATYDTYEPGSTFKIVTMAAGLNAHLIKPTTSITDPGWIVFPQCSPIAIHNWNFPTSNGTETMTQVLQHSANVGASWVADLLGRNRFYRYVRRFGVGSPTGVDLAGEISGYVPLPDAPGSNWTCVNLYDNSFGQSLTVTPLQMLNAVNAVANHGVMMRPSVVNRIDYRGATIIRAPHKVRRVISRRSAHTLTNMLVNSALGPSGDYGEAACALVPGYNIAAKTGTANIAKHGIYLKGPGSTIASTVAYAPAYHPRFSVIVIIRKPRFDFANYQWGSETAAPMVHDLLNALFLHYHIPPTAKNSDRVLESQRLFGGCNF